MICYYNNKGIKAETPIANPIRTGHLQVIMVEHSTTTETE